MRQVREPVAAGALSGPARKYLASTLAAARETHQSLIVPAAEQMDLVRLAIAAGWSADRIFASDIGLVPRLIGSLVDPEHPFPDVDVDPEWEKHAHDLGAVGGARRVAFLLWLIQRQQTPEYRGAILRHLDLHAAEHVDRLEKQLVDLTQPLVGVRFTTTDMREAVLTAGAGDFVVVDAPSSSSTFDKAHAFEPALHYEAPAEGWVWHREQTATYLSARESDATQMWMTNPKVRGIPADDVVYAVERKPSQVDYWHCTHPDRVARGLVSFNRRPLAPYPAPVFGEGDVLTPDSRVDLVIVDDTVTSYYRNLWVHKLSATSGAEIHVLVLLDGKVFSAILLRMTDVLQLKSKVANLISDFCAPHPVYKRGARLASMLCLSRDFQEAIKQVYRINRLWEIEEFQTTSFSKYRKTKGTIGIWRDVERTRQPNGLYKINHRGTVNDQTFRQCLERFIREEAEHAASTAARAAAKTKES